MSRAHSTSRNTAAPVARKNGGVNPLFEVALVLAHETGHRTSSIRQLRWSDVDTPGAFIRCRGEHDKIGMEHSTRELQPPVPLLAMRGTCTAIRPTVGSSLPPGIGSQRARVIQCLTGGGALRSWQSCRQASDTDITPFVVNSLRISNTLRFQTAVRSAAGRTHKRFSSATRDPTSTPCELRWRGAASTFCNEVATNTHSQYTPQWM